MYWTHNFLQTEIWLYCRYNFCFLYNVFVSMNLLYRQDYLYATKQLSPLVRVRKNENN